MKPDTKAIRARADAAKPFAAVESSHIVDSTGEAHWLRIGEREAACDHFEEEARDFAVSINAAVACVPALCDRVEALEAALRLIESGTLDGMREARRVARAALEGT